MGKSLLWKIGGEAGFGIMTSGNLFSKIAARHGYHIFDTFDYPSLIRGGHNTCETIIADKPVLAGKREIDILICLNKATFENHKNRLHKDSVVVFDDSQFTIDKGDFKSVPLPFHKYISMQKASMVMMNNIAMGASLALMGWDIKILDRVIAKTFARKGQPIVLQNQQMAHLGYDQIVKHYKNLARDDFPYRKESDKLIITGNDAFALGAVAADCRLYVAYPMTPSSTVLTTLAGWAEQTSMVVRHAEDEISVINTALGGSFAGVRAAVGTSGGGFALMVESLSFAGVAEIPIVVFLSQRPGPATGMPTWTEQGDLLFAAHAGHGEFPKIVLAPGDAQEMYELTAKAFDLADIYQTPVIVMSDKYLSENHWSTPKIQFKLFEKSYKADRGKITAQVTRNNLQDTKNYLRYKITDDGISPMLIPGQKGLYYQANSYEHIEDGHTTEEHQLRIEQVDKRNRKWETYFKNDFEKPKIYGDLKKAEIVFVSWGSLKGQVLEAMKLISLKTALIHFTHVYPIDAKKIQPLFGEKKKYILLENNSHAQFGQLLRMQTGIVIKDKLLRYDGRQIEVEAIVEYALNL